MEDGRFCLGFPDIVHVSAANAGTSLERRHYTGFPQPLRRFQERSMKDNAHHADTACQLNMRRNEDCDLAAEIRGSTWSDKWLYQQLPGEFNSLEDLQVQRYIRCT